MAIENEQKFILNCKPDMIGEFLKIKGSYRIDIVQSYIGDVRIRKQHYSGTENPEYIFAWKFAVPDSFDLIEIEKELSKSEFDVLCQNSSFKIEKIRVDILTEYHWSIDFLYFDNINNHYLTLAECEMPDGMEKPSSIPDIIKRHIVYEIPRSESGDWTNKKLSNKSYVGDMLRKINVKYY